ncbi:hypothetical protein [Aeromonas allosaccharophila]|uniref:hypothetical protein n=1 Tax=Aeromonas allosaccharophila TaxID=656 RepID=UPI003005E3DD
MQRLDISQGRISVVWGDRERIYSIPVAGQVAIAPWRVRVTSKWGDWLWAVEDRGVEDGQSAEIKKASRMFGWLFAIRAGCED